MTTSTADDDPPRCHHNSICTATAPPPIRELIAAKDDTRGTDSTRNPTTTTLREIPTRISPTAPTADAVDRHDDDDNVDRRPQQTTPHLSPKETNSAPFSSPPATNDYVDRTLDKIQTIMRSWSSHPVLIRAPHDVPCPTPHHPSSLPQPEPLSADEGPFDTGSTLDKIAEKVNQLQCRIAATFPSGDYAAITMPHSPSPPLPEPLSANDGTVHIGSERDHAASVEPMCHRWPSTINTTSPSLMTEPPQCGTVISEEESNDPSLLAAAYSLDNFLLKYPRTIELHEDVEGYKPSPDQQVSISRHALWTQQTLVLCTMNVVLSELHEKLSRFIDTLFRLTPHPRATLLQLPPHSRTPITPVPTVLRLPVKAILPYKKPIPAKPPFPSSFTSLRLKRTKDYLRPP